MENSEATIVIDSNKSLLEPLSMGTYQYDLRLALDLFEIIGSGPRDVTPSWPPQLPRHICNSPVNSVW